MNSENHEAQARALQRFTAETIDYAHPLTTDCWGDRSIALLGDSGSFGVGASDALPENCYVGYVKKAVQAANGGRMNYGFTSAYSASWQPHNFAFEVHGWPDRAEDDEGNFRWTCDGDENGNRLISVGMTSIAAGAPLTYTLRAAYAPRYAYFCVYYHATADGGEFSVADGAGGVLTDVNGNGGVIPTADTVEQTKRTAFYRLADCPTDADGLPQIILCKDNTARPVTITGIGYYQEITADCVTFNSYTRGGISLVNMSDTVLSQAASAAILILAIGFNDAIFNHKRVRAGEFTDRIDYLIRVIKENGTHLIVHDYCWDNETYLLNNIKAEEERAIIEETRLFVKSELLRLARETGGVYVDQATWLGDAINADLNSEKGDGIHPTNAGHRMIAQNIVAVMGLEWTEDWI